MVVWWRVLQGIVTVGAILGVSYMFIFLSETTNYGLGLAVIFFGSFILMLMVVWVAKIQNNIENRKRK